MKKSILNLGTVLNKTEQKKINGEFGCHIAPVGCPCIVPPNHPCLNNGGGNGSNTGLCFSNFGAPYNVPCNGLCNDGTKPLCK